MIKKYSIIGVMGSGSEEYPEKTVPLGKWIAENGFHLLTGGGAGTMSSVARSFTSVKNRKGSSLGIVPSENGNLRPGYPNQWVEIPIITHLPLSGNQGMSGESRNHINILTSSVIIALPGKSGTSSEVKLALKYGKPLICFLDHPSEIPELPQGVEMTNQFDRVIEFINRMVTP
jgi:uncharacterized protein (TIGR00725 family)